jgi:broad specificity phosphatase PhoE
MPTRVFLIRHGETAVPHVFHGAESDVGLSPRGQRQAELIAPILAGHGMRAIISSAMRRAIDTATPIAAACAHSLRVEPDLHERRVGALCGTTFHAADGLWPNTLARWVAGDTSFTHAGAESFDDVRSRVVPVWQRLAADLHGQTYAVVAHGVVIKVLLLSIVAGRSSADWQSIGSIRNCALTELDDSEGGWHIRRLSQLPPELAALDPSSAASRPW